MVYSKMPIYNNLHGPGLHIKGPCYTPININVNLLVNSVGGDPCKNVKLVTSCNYKYLYRVLFTCNCLDL